MLGKLPQNSYQFMILFHHRPFIYHFVIIEITDKKLLTRRIFCHVFGFQRVPQ
ncbi:hypothetical protein Hanom_Chr12g01090981 [Helianthus anomalus]